jgi:hypothetical protein
MKTKGPVLQQVVTNCKEIDFFRCAAPTRSVVDAFEGIGRGSESLPGDENKETSE